MLLSVQPFFDCKVFDILFQVVHFEHYAVALSFCGLFCFLILASVKNINVV
jgi:hypothetical protein